MKKHAMALLLGGWMAVAGCAQQAQHGAENSELVDNSQTLPGLTLDLGNDVAMELALLPAGEFVMGTPPGEKDRQADEGPQRQVRISRAFYIGVTEVTQAQYQAVMGVNPSHRPGSHNPVEQVNWEAAAEFCRKLSEKTGRTVRLPTEAEWEYACRAGSTEAFSFGDEDKILEQYGWYDESSDGKHYPVKSLKPNAWGLYDMHGNVWEWCGDWYQNTYEGMSTVDPTGAETGEFRVLRGGSWMIHSWDCRSGDHNGNRITHANDSIGFRVVLEAPRPGV